MNWERARVFVLIVFGAVGLAALGKQYGTVTGFEAIELLTLDLRQRVYAEDLKAVSDEDTQIVLVLFDSEAVEEWAYESPFPRPFLAELINALSDAGARTIALDVYLERMYPKLNDMDGGDDLLLDAIERAGNVILVAPTERSDSAPPRLRYPHPAFVAAAADVGAADLPTPFEVTRDGLLAVRSEESLEPSWALAVYAHAKGLDADSILAAALNDGVIRLEGMPESVGSLPEAWIEGSRASSDYVHPFPLRYIGPPSTPGDSLGTFKAFQASLVPTTAMFVPEFFRDKIVLLGTGFHDSDKFRTPFYDVKRPDNGDIFGWTYGVEVHATALQNLLDWKYITVLSTAWLMVWISIPAAVTAGTVFWKGAELGAVAAVVSAGLQNSWAWMQFGETFLWIPMIAPLAAVLISYLGSTAYVSVVEGREKRFIRGAFGKYVPEAVVEEIAKRPELLQLGGQKRPLSLLFSDLEGFTTLSENLDPEALLSVLNDYLTAMTDLVMEEEGTLDKYIGDAIMAFWNAPKDQPDHCDRALRCAIRMQHKMDELNERWMADGQFDKPLRVRIGINSGTVVVGNVGGEERFDYSAIGDAVNLAARLEPANKTYDTLVMTSTNTLDQADRSAYAVRELDFLAVKGKSEPVTVYELVGFTRDEQPPQRAEALRLYDEGWAAYRRRDWALADQYFTAAVDADPSDGPSKLYRDRSREYLETPPPVDWDFVVRRSVK